MHTLLKILAVLALGPNLFPSSFCLCFASSSPCLTQNGCTCAPQAAPDPCNHEGETEHRAHSPCCKAQACQGPHEEIAQDKGCNHDHDAGAGTHGPKDLQAGDSSHGAPSDCLICQWLEHIDGAPLNTAVALPMDGLIEPLFLPAPTAPAFISFLDGDAALFSKLPLFLCQCRLLI